MGYYVYEPSDEWCGDGVTARAPSKAKALPLLEAKWAARLTELQGYNVKSNYDKVRAFKPKRVKRIADPKLEFGPRLTCCKKAKTKKDNYSNCPRRPLIMLAIDDLYGDEARKQRPPHWSFKGVKIKFCPWCATRLPKVEKLAKPPFPTHESSDGYYCNTCRERNSSCRCNGPAAGYRIVQRIKNDPQVPVNRPNG